MADKQAYRCVCGREWCFLCGEPYGRNSGCPNGCPSYGRQARVPMRERRLRYRQGDAAHPAGVMVPPGPPPPFPQGVPEPQLMFAPPQQPPEEAPGPLNHPAQGMVVQQMPQGESERFTRKTYKWSKKPQAYFLLQHKRNPSLHVPCETYQTQIVTTGWQRGLCEGWISGQDRQLGIVSA